MTVSSFQPQIAYLPLKTISPYQRQLRKPKPKQADKAKRFLQEFGFVLPVVIDQARAIVIGEVLFQAATELGFDTVPVVQIDHLDEAQIKALRIAYDRINEDAVV